MLERVTHAIDPSMRKSASRVPTSLTVTGRYVTGLTWSPISDISLGQAPASSNFACPARLTPILKSEMESQ